MASIPNIGSISGSSTGRSQTSTRLQLPPHMRGAAVAPADSSNSGALSAREAAVAAEASLDTDRTDLDTHFQVHEAISPDEFLPATEVGDEDDPIGGGSHGNYIDDLLNELDDRRAADDEALFYHYEHAQRAAAEADTNVSLQSNNDQPASDVHMPVYSPAELIAAKLLPPAVSLTPLTQAQLLIASEIDVKQTVKMDGHVAFSIHHPLWVAQGKKRSQQRAADRFVELEKEAEDNAARAKVLQIDAAAAAQAAAVAAAAAAQASSPTGPLSRKLSSAGGSRASSRGSSRAEAGKSPVLTAAASLAQTNEIAAASKERSLALSAQLLTLRDTASQLSLQESRKITLSKVSKIPLVEDNEFWQLIVERRNVHDALTVFQFQFALHTITIQVQKLPVSNSTTIRWASDGLVFREQFYEGEQTNLLGGGKLEDVLKLDSKVWNATRAWIGQDLLTPLSLSADRTGWIRWFEEFLPFESCGASIQIFRGLFDMDLAIAEVQLPKPQA